MRKRQTFGLRLKAIRESRGLSQAALAKAIGLPVDTLRNWEQDRREPYFSSAVRLAEQLGCSLDELAGRNP
jgi:transcriptional regulator with XRE-family HTH domain